MNPVRLWREERPADCWPAWHNNGAPPWGEYIALPAAQHAELVALLKRARTALAEALMVVGTLDADRAAYGASLLRQVDLARNLGLPTMDGLDAALAGLGGAGKGGSDA